MVKKELRSVYKNKRAELSSDEIEVLSLEINTTLLELLNQLTFQTLNCFLSSNEKGEVRTSSIINELLSQEKFISVPLSNYKSNSMQAVRFKKGELTAKDKFGIPVPTTIEIVPVKSIDILIVPLLCFDKKGHRVGYGKGMYDRFLNNCKKDVVTIGLSLFEAIEEIIDVDELDIPLNYVICKTQVFKFG
ncbi:MAG: 5-formyltetrahydrofolate cyclo-ligase [Saprospiraceae bacterium]|jgi:5-formyltetrahydrofolate cyclo-ligase